MSRCIRDFSTLMWCASEGPATRWDCSSAAIASSGPAPFMLIPVSDNISPFSGGMPATPGGRIAPAVLSQPSAQSHLGHRCPGALGGRRARSLSSRSRSENGVLRLMSEARIWLAPQWGSIQSTIVVQLGIRMRPGPGPARIYPLPGGVALAGGWHVGAGGDSSPGARVVCRAGGDRPECRGLCVRPIWGTAR